MSGTATFGAGSPGDHSRRRRSDARPQEERPPRLVRSAERPLTILVVDDAADIREMYARYFQFAGARVLTARDGLEAVHMATFFLPDAIVMDLAMPRMTGWEAIGQLKREHRTTRILIVSLTGHIFSRSKEDAVEAGVDLYVTKPCGPDVLFDLILQLLRGGSGGKRPRSV